MQQLKDALSKDMQDFLNESKWETHIKESVSEILEYKPDKPLVHLYEKFQIKQKIEAQNKTLNFINDLSFSAIKIDPLIFTPDQCIVKLLGIIVDKYQLNKIKKFDGLKSSLIILQEIPNNKDIKDYFLKKAQSQYEDILTVSKLSDLTLKTIIIYRALSELILLSELVEMKNQLLSTQNLTLFINETPESQSIFKKFELQNIIEKFPFESKAQQTRYQVCNLNEIQDKHNDQSQEQVVLRIIDYSYLVVTIRDKIKIKQKIYQNIMLSLYLQHILEVLYLQQHIQY